MDTLQLQAGFAKVDITPDYPVGLGGYSNAMTRRSKGVAAPVYATCIALREGEETILMYTIDSCNCSPYIVKRIRDVVAPATGIPADKIFCAATHAHNAPSINDPYPEMQMYISFLVTCCTRAAQLALQDLAPAKITAAKKKFPGWNFTRHVLMENGRAAGFDWQSYNSPVVGFAGTADDEMVLVKFAREEKKDILLINWQGHPDCSSQIGFELIAPSYIGPLRDTVEAGSGMHVAFFTGADGNMIIDCKSYFPEKSHGLNWRRYGVKIGTLALEALDELVEVSGTGIETRQAIVDAEVDHSWDHLLPQADEVFALWKSTDKATGDEAGKVYGFSSVYQARAIRDRARMEKTRKLELNAIRVGGIGFTTGSYEMFSESGIAVKEGSPFEFTFLLTGNFTYIPSENGFKFRCYEADTGYYVKGTAEKLVDKYLQLLNELR